MQATNTNTDQTFHEIGVVKGKPVEIPTLRELPLDIIKPDFAILVFGIRRTGKSFLTRYLLYHLRKNFPLVFCMTETKLNNFWQQHIPDKYVFEDFNEAVLTKYIQMQTDLIKKYRDNPDAVNTAKAWCFDDVVSSEHIRKSFSLSRMYTLGRHLHTFIILLTQHSKGVNPIIRYNTDMVIIRKMPSKAQRESIIEDYLHFIEKPVAEKLLDKYTQGHYALCILNTQQSNDPYDNLYWLKAEDPGAFHLGSKEMWVDNHPTDE